MCFFQILFSRIAIALPSYSSRRSKLTLMVKKFDRVCVNGNKKPVYRLLSAGLFSHCVFFRTSFTCKGFFHVLNSPRQNSVSCMNRPVFNSPADKGKRDESFPVYSVIFHTKIKETDLMVCGRKHLTMTVSLSPFSKYVLKDNNTCV